MRVPRAALGALLLLAIVLPAALAAWQGDRAEAVSLGAFLNSRGLPDVEASAWDNGHQAFDVSVPGCPARVQVLTVSSFLEDRRIVEHHFPPGSVKTFVYLGEHWAMLDHVKIWMTYAGAEARNVVRPRALTNLNWIIEIATPSRCDALDAIDWRGFWGDTR